MGNYQNQDIENKGYRSKVTRNEVFDKRFGSIISEESDKKAQEKAAERYIIQGNGKYTKNGSDDRVNGKSYDGDNSDLYPSLDDKRSYHYGYVVHGGRRLYAVIEELQKENKFEEIIAIGYRDFEHGIEEEYLGMLKQNEYYMEGYNAAQKAEKTR